MSKRRKGPAGRPKPRRVPPTVAGAAGAHSGDAPAPHPGSAPPPPRGSRQAGAEYPAPSTQPQAEWGTGYPASAAGPAPEPTTAWGRSRRFADRHPLLLSWIALSIGMVAILVYTSRDVGLQPSQLFAMIVATIALAGACVWIISWE
ncbi:MAG TPA: hypothetical protein VG370_11615 [Chloroflexota bacterium]|nr:hypothetical protein [Chloroflexota bacterium]